MDEQSASRSSRLLDPSDPEPAAMLRAGGAPILVVCDHAGRAVPRRLGRLGIAEAEFDRHIAYDIGAAGLAQALAQRLGACLITQAYSRLVIDCNRAPGRPDLIAEVSDGTVIPANAALSPEDVAERIESIHQPYHAAIAAELDRRAALGERTALVSIHSFTPVMAGRARPWQVGVLHQANPLSLAMLTRLQAEPGLTVGDNEPYAMDAIDYTAPVHAQRRGLEYLELETRQDLIADEAGQQRFADLFARLSPQALGSLRAPS